MDEVKMFLFARWIATCYADTHLDSKMKYEFIASDIYLSAIKFMGVTIWTLDNDERDDMDNDEKEPLRNYLIRVGQQIANDLHQKMNKLKSTDQINDKNLLF